MEGAFGRALITEKEDRSEVVAKIPFPIAGPPDIPPLLKLPSSNLVR